MLYLSSKLHHIPLASIRSGGRIGMVIEPIINPTNLHIDAFYCQSAHSDSPLILLDIDIRDLSPRTVIIDDHVTLSEPDELVRLKPILDLNFSLVGKQAYAGIRKIGKVTEYAVDAASLFITKIYVQPPAWKSFGQDQLTFDRKSVIEVTPTKIVFSGPEQKIASQAEAALKNAINLTTARPAVDAETIDN